MKITTARCLIFFVSIFMLIAFEYTNLTDKGFLFRIINALAGYFVIYEIMLQFIRVLYRDTYNYLMQYLDGNIKLNRQLHDNDPLTLFEKTKTVLMVVSIHLLSIIFSVYTYLKF